MWTEKQKKDAYEILLLQQQGLLEAEDYHFRKKIYLPTYWLETKSDWRSNQ
ncbi:hypothetical protein EfmAA818_18290 [Enterococcus faecium]|nr:hypothetical protein EfmAA818_18290 [Enterococcus faecium]